MIHDYEPLWYRMQTNFDYAYLGKLDLRCSSNSSSSSSSKGKGKGHQFV